MADSKPPKRPPIRKGPGKARPAAPPVTPPTERESFDFASLTETHQKERIGVKKSSRLPLLLGVGALVLLAIVVGLAAPALLGDRDRAAVEPVEDPQSGELVNEVNRPPVFQPIGDKRADPGSILTFTVKAEDPDTPKRKLNFRLLPGASSDARIHADTGQFEWNLHSYNLLSADPQTEYHFTVRATEAVPGGLSTEETFTVRVEKLEAVVVDPAIAIGVDGEGAETPAEETPTPPKLADLITEPIADPIAEPIAASVETPAGEYGDEVLLERYKRKRLFFRAEYPALRKLFADRFEKRHTAEIEAAYGEDLEAMTAWLAEHVEIKEEFYTAIDPQHDDVASALALWKELWKQFPDKMPQYAELAIALAVTWDRERGAVYDYAHHQRRTKTRLPEGSLGAVENFAYLITGERFMQLRAEYLPWEFLVHVINHRTPSDERQWALTNYTPKIVMYGKCYKDVPYDTQMLETAGQFTQLEGQDYTLENLRQFGGVCAMQADFASRVGKSMAVPAAYVRGESRSGELHAWVMWVELGNVTSNSIAFTLQSEGRYRGDRYYVGNLGDPQSGQPITDRLLEMRLDSVGRNPRSRRHADLIMKAYPLLLQRAEMDVAAQIMFLRKLLDMCPKNEAAWIALAAMSRGGVLTKQHSLAMKSILDGMYRTFAQFPDFTWQIFDDLVAFQDVPKLREQLFGQLVAMYEQAGRPDLACEARLKYTEYLVADQQYKRAVEGLQMTILRFPEEGRYVPRMLDRVEEICRKSEAAGEQLLDLYRALLPKIPRLRGDRPSNYCIEMLDRAMARFREAGDTQWVQLCAAELAKLRVGETGLR
ncbi:MAG: cadherin repeat domain-containing protein [Thermoguttaceae bacterium]